MKSIFALLLMFSVSLAQAFEVKVQLEIYSGNGTARNITSTETKVLLAQNPSLIKVMEELTHFFNQFPQVEPKVVLDLGDIYPHSQRPLDVNFFKNGMKFTFTPFHLPNDHVARSVDFAVALEEDLFGDNVYWFNMHTMQIGGGYEYAESVTMPGHDISEFSLDPVIQFLRNL